MRGDAQIDQRFLVFTGAVSGVTIPAITREFVAQFPHDAVTRDFSDDTGSGDGKAFGIAANNGFYFARQVRGAVPIDKSACKKCHQSANVPIRDFYSPNHPDMNGKIWLYGNTPGSDKNLRWNPWDPGVYANFGFQGRGDNRRIRPAFAPIVEGP